MANGFFGKVKELVGLDEEYEEYEEYEDQGENDDVYERTQHFTQPASMTQTRSSSEQQTRYAGNSAQDKGKVVKMVNSAAGEDKKLKIVVTEPKNFNDSTALVDTLLNREPVIINLENVEREVAQKIFDFLSGAIYALDGKVQKVSDSNFVFAPRNVDVNVMEIFEDDPESERTMKNAPWRR